MTLNNASGKWFGSGIAVSLTLAGSLAFGLSGCQSAETKSPTVSQAPAVQVATVERRDVSLTSEWIASMDGYVNAQIQPHVSGYLIRQNYREGSFVHQGDVLFEIDPRPFQVALDQSRAQLKQAQAQVTQTQAQMAQAQAQVMQTQAQVLQAQALLAKALQDVTRDTPLAEARAIAQSRLDDDLQAKAGATAAVAAAQAQAAASQSAVAAAQATVSATQAAVGAAQSAVEQAELNLSYTKISSLVDGISGIARAQIGDLVATTTVLTSVSQLDPIKAYFSISEQDYLRARKAGPGTKLAPGTPLAGAALTLLLSDGSTYPHPGQVLWTDRQIDTSTGTIRVAAAFANPGNVLRPGEYGKIRAVTEDRHDALLVPQAGVTELQGSFHVAVVSKDNKVEIRPVKIGAPFEGNWIVTEGVAFGDRVVVGGLQYALPGATVNPVAAPIAAPIAAKER
jgi:membrane fusion protein (multidrug efflux system)